MSGLSAAAGGGGGTSANKKALAKLQSDANMLQGLVDQLMGKQYNVGAGNYGGLAGAGIYGGGGGNVNITVNGAIDSESTARQIVEILNDSAARGTLGAAGFSR
jgi:hypothetical protein